MTWDATRIERESPPRADSVAARGRAETPIPTQEGAWVYDDPCDPGVKISFHDFRLNPGRPWQQTLQSDGLEVCLNVAGNGVISGASGSANYEPMTAGFYASADSSLRGSRRPGERHQFGMVACSAQFLRRELAPCDGSLHPLVAAVVQGTRDVAGVSGIRRLTAEQQRWVPRLLHPPVFQAARGLWYRSRVLELMAEFFFQQKAEDELFCDRQKRLARERADRVVALLRRRLAEPPSLDEIGREVGCSPFHLSRIFSRETGMTIPQFLRQIRMERAAELLRSGKFNVTEAAMEVGYSSLSHFSQAFCQTIGCCPALYPIRT